MNIAIIGAGVSGLSCAIRLLERGHRVKIMTERRTPAMDMTRYMPWLERRAIELGGTIQDARVDDLRQPFARGFELVVNASGLGARELARDEALTPMRGQIVHAPNDIGLGECFAD